MKLEEKVVNLLIKNNYHISFSESCTGGMVAATLVGVADASKVFNESFVTYANEAKIKYLGVSPDVIANYGVVSLECVKEMAEGTAKATNSEVAVSVSGIAGPSGGTKEKPVGTVCFGFYINGRTYTYIEHFGDLGRNKVRKESTKFVYKTLLKLLNK